MSPECDKFEPQYELHDIIAAETDELRSARLIEDALHGERGFYGDWQNTEGRRRIESAVTHHYQDYGKANDVIAILHYIDAARRIRIEKGVAKFITKFEMWHMRLGHQAVRQAIKDGIVPPDLKQP